MKVLFFSLLIILIYSCGNAVAPSDPIPKHDTFTIASTSVGEDRVINVWQPEGNVDSLPILYMPDGGVKEDFPHIANTLSELIAAGKIPPITLVGIENTQRRRDLTGFTDVAKDKEIAPVVGGSKEFRDFIKVELFPEIAKRYKVNDKKGIIGESLAGLFVIETFMQSPAMFDFYIAFDPSLWWNNQYLVKTSKEQLSKFPKEHRMKLWFAGSSAEDISKVTKDLSEIITAQNMSNLVFKYENESKEEHNTIFRATKEKALIWTLNNN